MNKFDGHRKPVETNGKSKWEFLGRMFGGKKAQTETPVVNLLEKYRGYNLRTVLISREGASIAKELFAGSPLKPNEDEYSRPISGQLMLVKYDSGKIAKLEESVLKDFVLAAMNGSQRLEEVRLRVPELMGRTTWENILLDAAKSTNCHGHTNGNIAKHIVVEGETLKLSAEMIGFVREKITSAGFAGQAV